MRVRSLQGVVILLAMPPLLRAVDARAIGIPTEVDCSADSAASRLSVQDSILGFERLSVLDGIRSRDWATSTAPGVYATLDSSARIDGRYSMRLHSDANFAGANLVGLGTLLASEFAGRRLTIRACLKSSGRIRGAGLWARVFTRGPGDLTSRFRADSSTRGATSWHSSTFTLDVPANASAIEFGAALYGDGELWADRFTLLRDDSVYVLPGYDTPPGDVVEWTRRSALQLETTARGLLATPERLANALGNARFVLLGEATHGTAEFTLLKSQLTLALIRAKAIRTVALEANLGEVAALNDYVNLRRSSRPELLYWTYRSHEFIAFVDSLRAVNKERPGTVGLFGIDALEAPGESADSVRSFIARYEVAYRPILDSLYRGIPTRHRLTVGPLSGAEISQWYFGALAVRTHLDTMIEQARVSQKDTGDVVLARHYADRVVQEPLSRFDTQNRDSSMAANLVWLSQHQPGRMVAWMHNLHAMKTPARTGGYLRMATGPDAVYSLALIFGEGAYVASGMRGLGTYASAPPANGSAEELLVKLQAPLVFLPLSPAGNAGLPRWFQTPRQMTAIGSQASTGAAHVTDLARAFDALLFVRRAGPASGIR